MKIKRLILAFVVLCSIFSATLIALPATANAASAANCNKESSSFLGFPTWYKYLNPNFDGKDCKLSLPKDVNGNTDFSKVVPPVLLAIFEIILRLGGLVAVGFVIYGGFQYVLSQGEPDKAKNARGTIINALIGLVITILSTAIVSLVANGVSG